MTAATIRRPRLLDELDRGATLPLTLLAAPAGSGKSVLVTQWMQERCGETVFRMTVDPDAAAGRPFWAALLAALDATPSCARPDAGLVSAAIAAATRPLAIVLDDLHLVRDRETLAKLDRLIAQLPPGVRVIVCSRRDPQLSVHRLRLEGQLLELRAADLAFELGEARDLLALDGVELPDEDLAVLVAHTEGWAAALRLAGISLRRCPDAHAFVCDFTGGHRAIADYLAEQVLAAEPAEVRHFLLATCVPDAICGELADALTGRPDGQARLASLEGENLLVTRVGDGPWFRYHPLLLELLRSQLSMLSAAERAELHRRAAHWLGANGRISAALEHAVLGGDWELATELVAAHWLSLFVSGEGAPVATALARLPRPFLDASPEAVVAAAMTDVLVAGDHASAELRLRLAAALADGVPAERRDRFERSAAVVRIVLDRARGDLADATDALTLLARPEARGADELSLAAIGLLNAGLVTLYADDPPAARATLEDALDLARAGGRDFVVLSALAGLALLEVGAGRLQLAVNLADEGLAIARDRGWTELTRMVPLYAALAASSLARGELDQADDWLARARGAAADETDPNRAALLALLEAELASVRGDPHSALRCLRRSARELERWRASSWLDRIRTGLTLRVLIEAQQVGDARRLVAHLGPAAATRLEVAVPVARIALTEDDQTAALAALAAATVPPYGSHVCSIDAALVAALAHEQLLDANGAAAAVERALELAEPERAVQPFIRFSSDMRRLLGCAVRHGTSHRALVEELLDRLDSTLPTQAGQLRESLTERELAVLRYLPTSLSAAEMAAELFVSRNTVKTHMRHVYRKLDVSKRSDAVRRAREVGLLGKPLAPLRIR